MAGTVSCATGKQLIKHQHLLSILEHSSTCLNLELFSLFPSLLPLAHLSVMNVEAIKAGSAKRNPPAELVGKFQYGTAGVSLGFPELCDLSAAVLIDGYSSV